MLFRSRGSVPYFPLVQQQMADANRAADLRVVPVLRAGKTPGTVETELKVEDKLPLHASLELNNYASANTTPLRLTGMVRYDNLWQKEHSLSMQYQTSPGDMEQVKVLSGTYLMPLAGSDNQLALYSVVSRSNVTRLSDRMEKAGLVARSDCPVDGRGTVCELTAKGRALRAKMWPLYKKQIESLFGKHLDAREAESLAASFETMIQSMKEETP